MTTTRQKKEKAAAAATKTAARSGRTEAARKSAKEIKSTEHAPLTIGRPELLIRNSDKEFRRLVHNFFAFAARHEAVRAGHAASIGLTGIEYTFLIAIRHLGDEGNVSVKLLADHLHLSSPFATTMVGKLIKRKLVVKESDPEDKRRVQLRVTPAGHQLLAKLAATQRRVNDVQFGSLSRSDFEFLLEVLDRLIVSGDQALALQSYLATQPG
jgi:DNA-binding MarR family transcriptional regulator